MSTTRGTIKIATRSCHIFFYFSFIWRIKKKKIGVTGPWGGSATTNGQSEKK
jgi:hypothetical protein